MGKLLKEFNDSMRDYTNVRTERLFKEIVEKDLFEATCVVEKFMDDDLELEIIVAAIQKEMSFSEICSITLWGLQEGIVCL